MTKENYEPFGKEWKKEVMKMSKSNLIEFLLRPALMNANQKQVSDNAEEIIKTEYPDKSIDFIEGFISGYEYTNQKQVSDELQKEIEKFKKGMEDSYGAEDTKHYMACKAMDLMMFLKNNQ